MNFIFKTEEIQDEKRNLHNLGKKKTHLENKRKKILI